MKGDDAWGTGRAGPLTGGNFAPWSDRLREVEEVVDSPELRAGVAGARERARLMRLEYRRDLKKPIGLRSGWKCSSRWWRSDSKSPRNWRDADPRMPGPHRP